MKLLNRRNLISQMLCILPFFKIPKWKAGPVNLRLEKFPENVVSYEKSMAFLIDQHRSIPNLQKLVRTLSKTGPLQHEYQVYKGTIKPDNINVSLNVGNLTFQTDYLPLASLTPIPS